MTERKKKLDRQHELPISRQCSALDISRSSAYRKPAGVNDDDVDLMHKLDALHLRHPFKGSRRLRDEGIEAAVEGVVAQFLFDDGGKAAKAFAKIDGVAVQVYPRHITGRPDIAAHDRRLSSW